jgi:integrase
VDFDNNVITVRQAFVHGRLGPTKNMKEREVGMTATLRAALLAVPVRTGFVFPNAKGTPYQQDTATKRIHAACARAGLPKFGWHLLRHTFASHLVIREVPLIKIRDLLGHSSVKVTERYAHLLPNHSAQAVSELATLGIR